ncbi:TIGR02611 family protein [Saxibacter everestensis]|uniref:TIGR02611 family protein n=1 Tax=Saxibacter everestensis TaxID=2909229 RepID=A0ABY8QY02_9MICO|nr:TIGR02611 family protein [Brevibacteriaceae bacterium ZFBP1038]
MTTHVAKTEGAQQVRRHRHAPVWMRKLRLGFHRWRFVIRSNPHSRFWYRFILGALATLIVIIGLLLVPLPGPGWLIVFIGITILSTEFGWAKRILHRGRALVTKWSHWLMRRHMAVRLALSLSTFLFVCAIVYGVLRLTGLPDWVPADLVPTWLGLELSGRVK